VNPNGGADRTRAMQGRNAGFVTRTSANVIDGVVILIVWVGAIVFAGLVRYIAHPLRGFRLPALPTVLTGTMVCVLAILYFTATWSGSGRSVGKRMAGLRVTGPAGARLGAGRAFLRAALCVVFPIGFLWLLVSRHNESLYDMALSTSVVYDWGLSPHVPAASREETPRPGT
jgi:uncharacterized RDD family membrane protein YckC